MEFLFYHRKNGKSHAFRRVAKFDAVVSLHTVIARRSFSETPYHIIGFSPDTIDRWFFYFHTLFRLLPVRHIFPRFHLRSAMLSSQYRGNSNIHSINFLFFHFIPIFILPFSLFTFTVSSYKSFKLFASRYLS